MKVFRIVKASDDGSMTEINYDASQFPEYLQIYYKRLFPFGPYYKWLTYGLAPQVGYR